MTDLAERPFRRILIIKPSSPGDIIHALPVLHGLRRRYPEARLAWLVATPYANLLEADPALDEIIRFDRKRFGRLGRSASITGEFARFVHGLRGRRFDLVLDLQGLFRSGFLAWATGAAVRIGPGAAREVAWVFYTHLLPRGPREAHAADRNYAVARLLGFADVPMDFTIGLTSDDRLAARQLLLEIGLIDCSVGQASVAVGMTAQDRQCVVQSPSAVIPPAPHGAAEPVYHGRPPPYAVLVPATRWETKCWLAERFGRLAALIRQHHGLVSVLLGGSSDAAIGELAVRASNGSAVSLCGRTTLRQLAAVVETASIVVTADSTPMHMAAALGRPLVALFGPTNPRRTGPFGRLGDVVRLPLDCSPCYLRKLRQCPFGHACMQDLTVELVAEEAARRL